MKPTVRHGTAVLSVIAAVFAVAATTTVGRAQQRDLSATQRQAAARRSGGRDSGAHRSPAAGNHVACLDCRGRLAGADHSDG